MLRMLASCYVMLLSVGFASAATRSRSRTSTKASRSASSSAHRRATTTPGRGMVVRHMRKYIPGNPNFVVENMPGAGSLIAANYLYNKAAQDGTVLGSVSRNIPNYAFTKKKNVLFDPLKFNWIGSPEMTHRGCFATADSGVDDAGGPVRARAC